MPCRSRLTTQVPFHPALGSRKETCWPFLQSLGLLFLVANALPRPAAAAGFVGHQGRASITVQDFSYTFPITNVGDTSYLCTDVCFCSDVNNCQCDRSGTIQLNHDLSAPFSAYDYRLESSFNPDDCSGGTPVSLPTFVDVNQKLVYTVSFSPTTTGTFNDYLNLSGYNLFVAGSTPTGSPNLVPYTPPGWSDSLVASTVPGTQQDSPVITSGDTIYVSWAVLNNGDQATSSIFYTDLYLDGSFLSRWFTNPPLDPGVYVNIKDYSLGPLAPGAHRLELIPDSTQSIGPSNNFTKPFSVVQPSATLRLVATTLSLSPTLPPSAFSDCSQIAAATLQTHAIQRVDLLPGATLSIAIGEGVSLQVVQINADGSDGPSVSSTFSLLNQAPATPPAITSVLATQPTPLFDGKVVLPFSAEPQNYFAAHSGTATLGVTAGSTSMDVAIAVTSSGYKLGSTHHSDVQGNDVDGVLFPFADVRGIPPQVAKAVIHKETVFDESAYRYEPLTVDFAQVSTNWCVTQGTCSVGDLARLPEYLPYALDSSQAGGGNGLDGTDTGLRNKYYVTLDRKGVPLRGLLAPPGNNRNSRLIVDSDGPVSMENILYTNNTRSVVPGGWYTPGGSVEKAFHTERASKKLSPFTAQTVIAASYGLMQVLYQTAVEATYTMTTPSGTVGGAPDGLFDENANMDLGTATLVNKYNARPALPTQFAHIGVLARAWCRVLAKYNGSAVYGVRALILSDSYFPVM